MPVSPLLTVFGFLLGRATTVSTGYILFLLGLGLHLAGIRIFPFAATAEADTILQN